MLRSFGHLSNAILALSWPENPYRSLMIFGFHIATALFKFNQIFSMRFKSGDLIGHSRIFYDQSLNQAWVDLDLSTDYQACTKDITILAKMAWYYKEPMMSFILSTFPLHATAKIPYNNCWSTSMFDHGDDVLLLISFAFFAPDMPLIQCSSLFTSLHKTFIQNSTGLSKWILACWSQPFMFFLVNGIRQNVSTWRPYLFSVLLLCIEMFLCPFIRSFCKSLAVQCRFFSVALIKHFMILSFSSSTPLRVFWYYIFSA